MVIDSDKYLKVPLLEGFDKPDKENEVDSCSLSLDYESFIYYTNNIDKIITLMDKQNNIKSENFSLINKQLSKVNDLLKRINGNIFEVLRNGKESFHKINLISSNIENKIKEINSKYSKVFAENTSEETSSMESSDEFFKLEKYLKDTELFCTSMKSKLTIEILRLEGEPILFNQSKKKKDFAKIAVEKISDDSVINLGSCVSLCFILLIVMVTTAIILMESFNK